MVADLLARLGIQPVNDGACTDSWLNCTGPEIVSLNPATGQPLARVKTASLADYERVASDTATAFLQWRLLPPPTRGEIVRQMGLALREQQQDLGRLVSLETGKIESEGRGEVQEMIDMCDYAVGLSRQLFGLTMASERRHHRLFEQWLPLGPVGVITAFNFPVAVWAWNACLGAVCGDTCLWKPSSETPLTAIAVQHIVNRVLRENGVRGALNLCLGGGGTIGNALAADRRFPLISATGSCEVGRRLAQVVAGRLGRSLLELGGNNAIIVTPSANIELALRAVTFAAVGTAGQRCTSLRRLILHESLADEFLKRLCDIYTRIQIGDPLDPQTLLGPLISARAVDDMLNAVTRARDEGAELLTGGDRVDRPGFFVQPTILRARPDMPITRQETFAPILYAMTYRTLDEAIRIQNDVNEGLSSAIFTDRLSESEWFLSSAGSDCGIANVNIGTSGAEIGGAFGGEKDTGGGREAGSDAWKTYMRRQTCTINFGSELPLAQGVTFDVR